MSSEIPAGWYPDPLDHALERWWDGRGWTKQTQDPAAHQAVATVSAGPQAHDWPEAATTTDASGADAGGTAPRRTGRWVGIAVLALLLVLMSAGGTVFLLQVRASTAAADADHVELAPVPESPEATTPDEPPAEDEPAAPSGEELPSDPEPSDAGEPQTPRLVTVTLDGQCTLTLDEATIAQSDRIRPWDHPECVWAPVVLPPGDERWIVVLASLNAQDFGPVDAQGRAQGLGAPDAVLWSTHYPSLNPDLWVVYDGPFLTEEAAAAAARGWSTAAYPRVLSDDPGDRYCLSPDGCIGEQAGS